MKYLVDVALCCGHASCAAKAPAVYRVDETEGVNAELGRFVDVAPGLEDAAKAGAWACPDAAIRIFADDES